MPPQVLYFFFGLFVPRLDYGQLNAGYLNRFLSGGIDGDRVGVSKGSEVTLQNFLPNLGRCLGFISRRAVQQLLNLREKLGLIAGDKSLYSETNHFVRKPGVAKLDDSLSERRGDLRRIGLRALTDFRHL